MLDSLPTISQGGITKGKLAQVPQAAGGSILGLPDLGLGVPCPAFQAKLLAPKGNVSTGARMQ